MHAVSVRTGLGLDDVRSYLGPGVTTALLGPSGVGKSTLVNTLAGEERLATGDVAADGSGKHTTTRRELIVLPGGGLVVDNPGMRELHLWIAAEGLEEAFDDIAALEAQCRFSDCRHESEPDAPCGPHSTTAGSRPSAGSATASSSASSPSSTRPSPAASAPAPGAIGRTRETHSVYEEATFAAPFVRVVVNAQSTAALFVSLPFGIRDNDPATVFESTTVSASAVPSTRLYVCPSIIAAVISPSYESASSSAGHGADQRHSVRRAVLRLDVERAGRHRRRASP